MILYNGKKLDQSHNEDGFVRTYKDQIKFLKGLKKKYFVFTWPDNKVRVDEDGNIHTGNGALLPFRESYYTYDNGVVDIVYYKNSFFDKHGNEQFRPRRFDFRGPMSLNIETDEDLIWFLVFVSPHIEKPDWLDLPETKKALAMNRVRKIVYFKLENRVRQAEKEYDFMADVQKCMSAIYDEEKGLQGEQLVYVARNYNVATGEGITERAVRQELGKIVLKLNNGKYDKKVITEFLSMIPSKTNETSVPEAVMAQAIVNDLKELNLIRVAPKGTKMSWVTAGGEELIRYAPTADSNAVIVEYLVKNPELRNSLEEEAKKKQEAKKTDEPQTE